MAYRFNGSNGQVVFAQGAIAGYTFGPATIAVLVKLNGSGYQPFAGLRDQFTGFRFSLQNMNGDLGLNGAIAGGITIGSTSVWYLLAATVTAAGVPARLHVWNGSAWSHAACGTNFAGQTVVGTDLLKVGGEYGTYLNADVVCAGIKKASSSDAQVETLTVTGFPSWEAFGFDWLVGFEDAGTVADRSTVGTGDETSRVGTTLVSDPPGWSWAAAPPPIPDPATTDWVPVWSLDAAMLVTGTGAPDDAAGVDGAVYLDTSSGSFYGPKAAGAWPATEIGHLT